MLKSDDKCPLCNGRGIVIIDSDTASPCKCMLLRNIGRKFQNAQICKGMLNCNFNQFNLRYYSKNLKSNSMSFYDNATAALGAAKKFVKDVQKNPHSDGIVLTGPVGCGKTFLAAAIANCLLEDGKEVLFIVVPDLLDQIRATFDSDYEFSEHDLINTARGVGILILDDLGAHNYTDWTRNKLYSIINYRLNNRLPTVITTNLDLAELEEYVGERTASRILQMCTTYRLMVETDIRLLKRHEKDFLK